MAVLTAGSRSATGASKDKSKSGLPMRAWALVLEVLRATLKWKYSSGRKSSGCPALQAQVRRPARVNVDGFRRFNDPDHDVLTSRATQHQTGRVSEGHQRCDLA